jgi:hypothetical protein
MNGKVQDVETVKLQVIGHNRCIITTAQRHSMHFVWQYEMSAADALNTCISQYRIDLEGGRERLYQRALQSVLFLQLETQPGDNCTYVRLFPAGNTLSVRDRTEILFMVLDPSRIRYVLTFMRLIL